MSTTKGPDSSPFRSRSMFTRITHRWHSILVIWLMITMPVLLLIYRFVEPKFEAFSTLRVTPISWKLYDTSESDQIDFKPYLQTQIGLIKSDRVLGPAIASAAVSNLSTIKELDDPKEFLREQMTVEIVPDTYLIRVALESPDKNQAAAIVNAVVETYLRYDFEYRRGENSSLRKNLDEFLEQLKKQIDATGSELKKLSHVATAVSVPVIAETAPGRISDPTLPRLSRVTLSQRRQIEDELTNTDLELIKAQSILEATDEAGEAENDPHLCQSLTEARVNVAALVKQREYQANYFNRLNVEMNDEKPGEFESLVLRSKLERLLKHGDQVSTRLEQLEFEASHGGARVTLIDDAVAPAEPTNNRQQEYMAAAPIVILLSLFVLALASPIKEWRVPIGE